MSDERDEGVSLGFGRMRGKKAVHCVRASGRQVGGALGGTDLGGSIYIGCGAWLIVVDGRAQRNLTQVYDRIGRGRTN